MSVDFVTQDLHIRPFVDTDRAAMGKLLTDWRIAETYMLPDFDSEAAVDRMFARFRELSQRDDRYVAGIYLDEELIGFLNDVEIRDCCVELGYVIGPDHWGKGYATQMLRGAVEDLFRRGYREVVAGAFEENKASIRVMVKAGMSKIALEEDIDYRGKRHHCMYYSVKRA